jgi:hypothetical protein
MPSSFFPSSLVLKTITLTDDNAKVLSNTDIPFYACDFQCQTNAIQLGNSGNMDFILFPQETYWTYNANLRDFMVKNETAAANGKIVIIATVPNAYVEKALGQGFKRF